MKHILKISPLDGKELKVNIRIARHEPAPGDIWVCCPLDMISWVDKHDTHKRLLEADTDISPHLLCTEINDDEATWMIPHIEQIIKSFQSHMYIINLYNKTYGVTK